MAAPVPPPAPPPPPPPEPPPGTPQNPAGTPQNPAGTPQDIPRVLRDALERAAAALGPDGGVRELLRRSRDSFGGPLQWVLFHRPAPPLIQDGPQCGLVALVMGGSLLSPLPLPPGGLRGVLGGVLGVARARGFTNHGEMFSAQNMAQLAQEVFPVRAELLQGGFLEGPNRSRLLRHLRRGLPALVPYDGDRNHAPCARGGHKAHWALLTGVVLGVPPSELGPEFRPDPEIPNLFHPPPGAALGAVLGEGSLPEEGEGSALVLAQQGKSPRPQMWPLRGLGESNAQLGGLDPRREGGGFVLPEGGVAEGLRGRGVLLYPQNNPKI